jgi:glutaredoxin-related protein
MTTVETVTSAETTFNILAIQSSMEGLKQDITISKTRMHFITS